MEFLENVALAPYTTFKIGGPARWFAEATHETEIVEAVEFAHERDLPLFVLGGGSNVLVSDAGFAGLVLHIALRGIKDFFEEDNLILRVAAGEIWDELVTYAVSLDCAGIECLAGIPGTVGGTPVQNVGAYGQEVSETILAVRALDLATDEFVDLSASECKFAYRQSRFNTTGKGSYIVTRVDYSLTAGGAPHLTYEDVKRYFRDAAQPPSLVEAAEAVRKIRREKGMYLVDSDPNSMSAGSFFKNPVIDRATLAGIEERLSEGMSVPQYPATDGYVKVAAAWLLDQAGFTKGYDSGRVGISTQHTLALVNRGGATAKEIFGLSDEIIAGVKEKFGITLEREPVCLG